MKCGPTHHFGCDCHEKQWRERLEKAERERDNAITDAKQFEVDCIRALHERNEAREQRDTLASAIRRFFTELEHAGLDGCIEDLGDDLFDSLACLRPQRQQCVAIAAVKGGGK